MMRTEVTTKQIFHMLEEAYRKGAKDQSELGAVNIQTEQTAVENIFLYHLRNDE